MPRLGVWRDSRAAAITQATAHRLRSTSVEKSVGSFARGACAATDQRVVEIHVQPKDEKRLAGVAAKHQDELQFLLREFSDTREAVSPRVARKRAL